jgi:hypothetical protein
MSQVISNQSYFTIAQISAGATGGTTQSGEKLIYNSLSAAKVALSERRLINNMNNIVVNYSIVEVKIAVDLVVSGVEDPDITWESMNLGYFEK